MSKQAKEAEPREEPYRAQGLWIMGPSLPPEGRPPGSTKVADTVSLLNRAFRAGAASCQPEIDALRGALEKISRAGLVEDCKATILSRLATVALHQTGADFVNVPEPAAKS